MTKLSTDKRYLIINADDFGMCHSANKAVFNMLKDKVITSCSIMPVCPWFEEAADFIRKLPGADVGIHLTFTSEWKHYKWGPLTKKKSLTDDKGYFPAACREFIENAKEEDVKTEIQRQIKKVKDAGINFTNIDNHMGSLYGLLGTSYLPYIFDICSKLKMPFRLPKRFSDYRKKDIPEQKICKLEKIRDYALNKGVKLIDYLLEYSFSVQSDKDYRAYVNKIAEMLKSLKPGVSELYIHPAEESKELKAVTASWRKRVMEYKMFYEDRIRNVIESEGIQLISWADLH